jgi:hypothetical protein
MLHRIVTATANADYSVDIAWDDGTNSHVSFASSVGRGVCAPMKNVDYFVGNMAIGEDGFALAWPNEVEFSADSLWYKAHPDDKRREIEAAE